MKFRVWYPASKEFLDPTRFSIVGDGTLINISPLGKKYLICDRNRFVYSMSTGLKDKDGREIYEGDILRLTMHDKCVDTLQIKFGIYDKPCGYDDFGTSGIGFYSESINKFRSIYGSKSLNGYGASIDEYRIVGNIYENPELLESMNEV